MGRSCPKFGRPRACPNLLPSINRTRVEFDSSWANAGQTWPGFDRIWGPPGRRNDEHRGTLREQHIAYLVASLSSSRAPDQTPNEVGDHTVWVKPNLPMVSPDMWRSIPGINCFPGQGGDFAVPGPLSQPSAISATSTALGFRGIVVGTMWRSRRRFARHGGLRSHHSMCRCRLCLRRSELSIPQVSTTRKSGGTPGSDLKRARRTAVP